MESDAAVVFLDRFPSSPVRNRVQQTLGRCLLRDKEYEAAISQLQQLANEVRLMRIYDGPTEIHNWVVARDLLR